MFVWHVKVEKMDLLQQKKIMLEYLMLKVHQQDWHGVADAAMDLREIEVKMKNPTKDK
jgi:hypothetical protein